MLHVFSPKIPPILFFAVALTLAGQIPLQAQEKKAPSSYVNLYTNLHKTCEKVGAELGMTAPCDNWIVACLNPVFECFKKADCGVTSGANPNLICGADTSACLSPDLTVAAVKFQSSTKCAGVGGNVSQPACGNSITEPHETCDDGNTQGGDACPADCGAVFLTDPAKCGNSQVEEGEECDAGAENDKASSGCDVECRKFNGADKAVTPNQTAPSAGGCSLQR